MFKSVGKFYQIGFDVQKNCRFNEFNFEVTGFCLNKTNDCKPKTIIDNLKSNIMKITAEANIIAAAFFESYANFGKEDVTKITEAVNTYTELGRSVGKVARIVLGFTKTHTDGGKRKRDPKTPKLTSFGDDIFEYDFEE
jgi:hypothetical protein